MTQGLTPSERFVTALSERAFLRLWTHPNPKGKKCKELCDCLVVCGPHIIVISVKECDYKDTGDPTGWERWLRDAIEKSAKQIWGAERFLSEQSTIQRSDGRTIVLPAKSERLYHRVSVSLGGRGEVPIKWGDFGNGFIHVCDEVSLRVVFGELDTITDFVDFLTKVENLVAEGTMPLLGGGGIEDLLAIYLARGDSFDLGISGDSSPDMFIVADEIWKSFSTSPEYKAWREDVEESYFWDRLIDSFSEDLLTDGMIDMHSKEVTQNELALVAMALQPRGYRANLARAFLQMLEEPELNVAARLAIGYDKTAFVFMLKPSTDRKARSQELGLRCLVIRGKVPDIVTVVGIATDQPGTSEIGYSSDIAYIYMPEWPSEFAEKVEEIRKELGYFATTDFSKLGGTGQ